MFARLELPTFQIVINVKIFTLAIQIVNHVIIVILVEQKVVILVLEPAYAILDMKEIIAPVVKLDITIFTQLYQNPFAKIVAVTLLGLHQR